MLQIFKLPWRLRSTALSWGGRWCFSEPQLPVTAGSRYFSQAVQWVPKAVSRTLPSRSIMITVKTPAWFYYPVIFICRVPYQLQRPVAFLTEVSISCKSSSSPPKSFFHLPPFLYYLSLQLKCHLWYGFLLDSYVRSLLNFMPLFPPFKKPSTLMWVSEVLRLVWSFLEGEKGRKKQLTDLSKINKPRN